MASAIPVLEASSSMGEHRYGGITMGISERGIEAELASVNWRSVSFAYQYGPSKELLSLYLIRSLFFKLFKTFTHMKHLILVELTTHI